MLEAFYFFAIYAAVLCWLFTPVADVPTVQPVPSVAPAPEPPAVGKAIAVIPVAPPGRIPTIRTLKQMATGKGIAGYSSMTQASLYQALKERGVL